MLIFTKIRRYTFTPKKSSKFQIRRNKSQFSRLAIEGRLICSAAQTQLGERGKTSTGLLRQGPRTKNQERRTKDLRTMMMGAWRNFSLW